MDLEISVLNSPTVISVVRFSRVSKIVMEANTENHDLTVALFELLARTAKTRVVRLKTSNSSFGRRVHCQDHGLIDLKHLDKGFSGVFNLRPVDLRTGVQQ
jgi:hypothetical protein